MPEKIKPLSNSPLRKVREKVKVCLANSWLQLLAGFLLLELVSFAVFPYPWLSRLAFISVLFLAGALAVRKTEYGAYLLLGELIIGGLGSLLFFPVAGGRLPLRLGLFVVIFLVWLVKSLKKQGFKKIISSLRDWRLLVLAAFFAIFCLAIIGGFLNGYSVSAVFSDFNGYLYFSLVGLFAAVKLKPMRLAQILFIGSFALGLKTLLALFVFSHGYAAVGPAVFYHWIRDTGTGEITLISAPLFRVFFQSHFYNLLALIFSVFILLARPSESGGSNAAINSLSESRWAKSLLWFFAWFNFFILLVSQSRSFWVAGLAVLAFVIPIIALYFKISWQRIAVYLLLIPTFAFFSNLAGQAVIGDFQTDFFTGRVKGAGAAAAVSSRMAELAPSFALIRQAPLLGHGFGATVHFRSDDPRIKNQSNPEGWTDAAAIEWGYLDLAIKTGLLGLLAYLAFLSALAWSLIKSVIQKKNLLAAGLLAGLAALLVVHIFTPYLNHPLGVGYLLVVIVLTKKSA